MGEGRLKRFKGGELCGTASADCRSVSVPGTLNFTDVKIICVGFLSLLRSCDRASYQTSL